MRIWLNDIVEAAWEEGSAIASKATVGDMKRKEMIYQVGVDQHAAINVLKW